MKNEAAADIIIETDGRIKKSVKKLVEKVIAWSEEDRGFRKQFDNVKILMFSCDIVRRFTKKKSLCFRET